MTDRRATWQNPKVLAVLAAVFCSGLLTGGLGIHLWSLSHPRVTVANTDVASPLVRARLKSELSLSREQEDKINMILADYSKFYGSLQEQYSELQMQMDDVKASGRQRILAVLNEQQRQRFDKLFSGEAKARQ